MDLRHDHGALIHVVRACDNADAPNLIAIGGENSVSVLLITDTSVDLVASFHIGSRITALAWSPRTVSSSSSDQWLIELTAASADFGLSFPFGGGLSGHHGPVNDMTFCGGPTDESARYVATDDKMLMVWDLHPTVDIPSAPLSVSPSNDDGSGGGSSSSGSNSRPQPTAYVISFPHALSAVCAHASTTKDLLVADTHGIHPRVLELAAPRAVAGAAGAFPASAAWQHANSDIIGSVHRSRFSLWDLSKLQGGKPALSGASFPEGAHRFRWCPTYPEYFAISTRNAGARGATIHVHSAMHAHAHGIPRIAAAVGHELVVFPIGVE
ncbi:hypothetical protein EDB83DRAFT_2506453 [Lactarius deliciosus]|nr:hypothetical protein EDB83DRAFT_2506453 [Lactarius deliciosus]